MENRKLSLSKNISSNIEQFKVDNIERIKLVYKNLTPILPESNITAKLELPGGIKINLPILYGTSGPPMIDVRSLYSQTGYFTFDPGYTCTGSCASQITFIDGEKGVLLYRGYKIQDICEKCDFVETCYLLLYGELPSKNDKDKFESTIKSEMLINEKLITFYKGFEYNAHPMSIMVGVVGALSSFLDEGFEICNAIDRELAAIKIVAKMPMIASLAFRTAMGLPVVYPRKDLTYSENFLYMMYNDPTERDFKIIPYLGKVLDILLILQADHEQNASTATVRIAGSSMANPFACIAAGISSLWGPLHGGANEAVLDMLDKIGKKENTKIFIDKVKAKEAGVKLMGFGHRVYKNYDPRAEFIKKVCHNVLEELKIKDDPYIEIALELERLALEDEYFIKRKLYPNVDFYSGIVLNAIGIPKSMFTVIFALSRTIGWISQWREMVSDNFKIGRPRQLYVGHNERIIKDIKERNDSYYLLSSISKIGSNKGLAINKP